MVRASPVWGLPLCSAFRCPSGMESWRHHQASGGASRRVPDLLECHHQDQLLGRHLQDVPKKRRGPLAFVDIMRCSLLPAGRRQGTAVRGSSCFSQRDCRSSKLVGGSSPSGRAVLLSGLTTMAGFWLSCSDRLHSNRFHGWVTNVWCHRHSLFTLTAVPAFTALGTNAT